MKLKIVQVVPVMFALIASFSISSTSRAEFFTQDEIDSILMGLKKDADRPNYFIRRAPEEHKELFEKLRTLEMKIRDDSSDLLAQEKEIKLMSGNIGRTDLKLIQTSVKEKNLVIALKETLTAMKLKKEKQWKALNLSREKLDKTISDFVKIMRVIDDNVYRQFHYCFAEPASFNPNPSPNCGAGGSNSNASFEGNMRSAKQ